MGFQDTFEQCVINAQDRAFGVLITLAQGPNASEPFTAVWEDHEYEVDDAEGFVTKIQRRDFMFGKDRPEIDGAVVKPRAGDRITFTENEVTKSFEILPVGNSQAVEEMPGGYRWLVHTKRIA